MSAPKGLVLVSPRVSHIILFTVLFAARGFDEHAALQPVMSSRKLPNEILLLSWAILATGLLQT